MLWTRWIELIKHIQNSIHKTKNQWIIGYILVLEYAYKEMLNFPLDLFSEHIQEWFFENH